MEARDVVSGRTAGATTVAAGAGMATLLGDAIGADAIGAATGGAEARGTDAEGGPALVGAAPLCGDDFGL